MCEVLIPFKARPDAPTTFSRAKSLLRIWLSPKTLTLRGLGRFPTQALDWKKPVTQNSRGPAVGKASWPGILEVLKQSELMAHWQDFRAAASEVKTEIITPHRAAQSSDVEAG
ncbi:hypothetical protein PBY51_018598 [Eleginops maclovinus]|uniref:Uncharacterized protein n=1 Tax=Eleginops maclovinus TaxID=56733 RepID=A0AAN7Y824_ELEMC|nr:hypothetical protein PBY51_018598 [Eleginops maclovinus]